jgi:proteasome lid subunit RPN8/RPN11
MSLRINQEVIEKIYTHGENAYPHEGAGLLLGKDDGKRFVVDILPLKNAREEEARHNRYMIEARDLLNGELEAERLGLDIVGVFHSHPDHPNQPSDFDRDWAMPWFSYIITSIEKGRAVGSRSWRLKNDRTGFDEEKIFIEVNETIEDEI